MWHNTPESWVQSIMDDKLSMKGPGCQCICQYRLRAEWGGLLHQGWPGIIAYNWCPVPCLLCDLPVDRGQCCMTRGLRDGAECVWGKTM